MRSTWCACCCNRKEKETKTVEKILKELGLNSDEVLILEDSEHKSFSALKSEKMADMNCILNKSKVILLIFSTKKLM